MKKTLLTGLTLISLTTTSGLVLAQNITPPSGIQPKQSISQTSKGKKSHGHCHGGKCTKGDKGTKN